MSMACESHFWRLFIFKKSKAIRASAKKVKSKKSPFSGHGCVKGP